MNLNKIDSALKYFQDAYQLSLKMNVFEQCIPIINLGEINFKMSNFKIALEYYKKALSTYNLVDNDRTIKLSILQFIGNTYYQLGKLDSAIVYHKSAFRISESAQYASGILTSSEKLSLFYKEKKMYDSTFKYQDIFILTKDSLFNEEKVRLLDNFNTDEEIRQNDLREKLIEEQKRRTRNIKIGIIALFIPTFSTTVYLFSRKKKKNAKLVTYLGLTSLLMFFEFITLVTHPIIERITNHDAILMYLALLLIAAFLVPLHHRLENWVKSKI